MRDTGLAENPLSILAVTQGRWGERIAQNIAETAPSTWIVHTWAAPRVIPPIVDYPEEYLPDSLPAVDLVLALGDVPGFAQLIPEVARLTHARAVLAPIDRNASLPEGLARQLAGWLEAMGVAVAFPKPLCSLTEGSYNRKPLIQPLENEILKRFASYFGRPQFRIEVENGLISEVEVLRDAGCGCASHVAQGLMGLSVDEAIEAAGLLHHHFPCLADMQNDSDYHDTLMHVSGNLLKDTIREVLQPYLEVSYIRPQGHHED